MQLSKDVAPELRFKCWVCKFVVNAHYLEIEIVIAKLHELFWRDLKMHMFHATLTIVLRGTSTFKCDVIRSSRVEPFVKWRLYSSTRIAKAYIRAYMQQNHILLHIHRRLEYFHGIIKKKKIPLCLGWWLPFSLNMCPAQWGLNLPTCPHTNPPSLITKLCN